MRVKNSIKNMSIAIFSQIIIISLGFISRKVLLDTLGSEYLGLNGFLTDILSLLGLVEGGVGASIVYNLYRPLAKKQEDKIIALVQLYKKLYCYIAIIVTILSIILVPFLKLFIKDGDSITNIYIVYFIFISRNIISYFNAHKWSLINADQKAYVLARINIIFNIITTIVKIAILTITKNYILFLSVDMVIFAVQNIFNGIVVARLYPYINTKKKYAVKKEVKDNIYENTKSLLLHNIGGYFVFGTDNILISSLISIKVVGIYSNYSLIVRQVSNLINPIIMSIGDSVGNLIAIEESNKKYTIFKVAYLFNFWIYSVAAIFLYNVVDEFIILYFGPNLTVNRLTFIVILVNFYINGLRGSIAIFKNKGGLFKQDKYIPLIEALINLVMSLILVKYFGLAGIFMGTTISSILIPLWNRPRLVYKYIFERNFKEYIYKYIFYAVLTVGVGIFTTYLVKFIENSNLYGLIIKGSICVIVPNILYLIIFYKTAEFKYVYSIIKNNIFKFKKIPV